MARRSEGWTLHKDKRTGKLLVRFTHAGRRYKRSTGTSDRRRATVEAAQIYDEVTSGRVRPRGDTVTSDEDLAVLFAAWIVAIEPEIDETTRGQYKMYCRTHWVPFFKELRAVNEVMAVAYTRHRLLNVRRVTVVKELSALRRFLRWALRHGYITEVPHIPSPPRRATGVDYMGGTRNKVTVKLTEAEVEAILAALPERTQAGNPARAFFTAMYETAFRRATLVGITAPHDYSRGAAELKIRTEIDKARWGRAVPLTDRARAAFDSVCPEKGKLFSNVDYRYTLTKAAKAAGLSDLRAKHLSNHDWRHAALTHMASYTTDLSGMGWLAGHKHATTTAKYIHAGKEAAARVLLARQRRGAATGPVEQPDGEAPPADGFRSRIGHDLPKARTPGRSRASASHRDGSCAEERT